MYGARYPHRKSNSGRRQECCRDSQPLTSPPSLKKYWWVTRPLDFGTAVDRTELPFGEVLEDQWTLTGGGLGSHRTFRKRLGKEQWDRGLCAYVCSEVESTRERDRHRFSGRFVSLSSKDSGCRSHYGESEMCRRRSRNVTGRGNGRGPRTGLNPLRTVRNTWLGPV